MEATRDTTAIGSHDSYINRELSWLSFARRVLALAEDPAAPLLERVKFAGIMGMILDEFVMKRMGGLHRKIKSKPTHIGYDGLNPARELQLCWAELRNQTTVLNDLIENKLKPQLAGYDILQVYENANIDSWEMLPNDNYARHDIPEGAEPLDAHRYFAAHSGDDRAGFQVP